MARRTQGPDEKQDLNLSPMMNLVIILIPMLLLSVVFLEVGVINMTLSSLTPSTGGTAQPEDEPLRLTVAISSAGLQISTSGQSVPAVQGCPPDGPTLCLTDPSTDVAAKVEEARSLLGVGNEEAAERLLEEALGAYDMRRLYNELMRIKQEHPTETVIMLSADADTPYAALVRVMDIARFKRELDSYASSDEFWNAAERIDGSSHAMLFGDPVLTLLQ